MLAFLFRGPPNQGAMNLMPDTGLPIYLQSQVKQALTHYARFFAALVGHQTHEAEKELQRITDIDHTLRETTSDPEYQRYFERRSQLMRIFHFQLVKKIEGQVQSEILEQAERLVSKLEILKDTESCKNP